VKPPLHRGLHRAGAPDHRCRSGPKVRDREIIRLLPQPLRRLGVAGILPVVGINRQLQHQRLREAADIEGALGVLFKVGDPRDEAPGQSEVALVHLVRRP
jgi:hypothetical protein